MANLCQKCQSFETWELPRAEKWSGTKFAHHESGSALRDAARKGCHLCNLVLKALLKEGQKPEGETEVPDRQIWLECREPNGHNLETRVVITVEPESLATAGFRNLEINTENTIIALSNTEIDDEVRSMMQGDQNSFGVSFFIVENKGATRFFYGETEIFSEDLFWALSRPYWQAHLQIATIGDKTGAILAECAQYEDGSTKSRASSVLMHGWLKDCIDNHDECNKCLEDNPILPTRVLDIGSSDEEVAPRLMVTKPGQRGNYAALSHRWGETKPVMALASNLAALQKCVEPSSMSQTFIDAIAVTRQLGLRYLWIDSLCIVQDSEEDWTREAKQMASVYRRAFITIAGVDTEDDKSGLYSVRNGLQTRPCKITLDAWKVTSPKNTQTYLCFNNKEYGDIFRRRGMLDSRGWVLQEQLLSTRVLNFKREGIYWECLHMDASEAVPEGSTEAKRDSYMDDKDYVRTLKRGISGTLNLNDPSTKETFRRAWFLTVQEYSRRQLTKEKDQIAALYGVIDEITKCTGDRFFVGAWKDDFLRSLLWCVFGPGCPVTQNLVGYSGRLGPAGKRRAAFRAPSWSWLGINGNIRYIESHIDSLDRGEVLVDYQLLQSPTANTQQPFGASGLMLRLTGPSRLAVPCSFQDQERMNSGAINLLSSEFLKLYLPNNKVDNAPKSQEQIDGSSGQPKTWVEANQWFSTLNKESRWFHSSTDADDEPVQLLSSSALKDAMLRQTAKNMQKFHADFHDDMQEDIHQASMVYVLFTFDGPREAQSKLVGFWAPDVPEEMPAVRYDQILPGYKGPEPIFIQVRFVGITRANGFVKAIGVVPVTGKPGYYFRVGMGWWMEDTWDSSKGAEIDGVVL